MRALVGYSVAIATLFIAVADCGGKEFSQGIGGPDASTTGSTSGTGSNGGSLSAGTSSGSASGTASGGTTGTGSGSASAGSGATTGGGSGAPSGVGSGSSSGSSAGTGGGTGTGGSGSGSGSAGSGTASAGSGVGSGAGSGSRSGSVSGSGSSSGSGASSGGGCDASCGSGRLCCNDRCVNPTNDPTNCGGCGIKCDGHTYCSGSACRPIPCVADAATCANGASCCGTSCCGTGQLCCEGEGPVQSLYPTCFTPTASQPTCPPGCSPLCLSDRNAKRDVEAVDDDAVLESVARLPISTWSYKSDDPSVRHLGPMAQDFHAAFGLGDTDKAYDPVDAHGVAFSAIRALSRKLDEQNKRIEELERENRELRSRATCGGR